MMLNHRVQPATAIRRSKQLTNHFDSIFNQGLLFSNQTVCGTAGVAFFSHPELAHPPRVRPQQMVLLESQQSARQGFGAGAVWCGKTYKWTVTATTLFGQQPTIRENQCHCLCMGSTGDQHWNHDHAGYPFDRLHGPKSLQYQINRKGEAFTVVRYKSDFYTIFLKWYGGLCN